MLDMPVDARMSLRERIAVWKASLSYLALRPLALTSVPEKRVPEKSPEVNLPERKPVATGLWALKMMLCFAEGWEEGFVGAGDEVVVALVDGGLDVVVFGADAEELGQHIYGEVAYTELEVLVRKDEMGEMTNLLEMALEILLIESGSLVFKGRGLIGSVAMNNVYFLSTVAFQSLIRALNGLFNLGGFQCTTGVIAGDENLGVDVEALLNGTCFAEENFRSANVGEGIETCGVDVGDAMDFEKSEEVIDFLDGGVVTADGGGTKDEAGMGGHGGDGMEYWYNLDLVNVLDVGDDLDL